MPALSPRSCIDTTQLTSASPPAFKLKYKQPFHFMTSGTIIVAHPSPLNFLSASHPFCSLLCLLCCVSFVVFFLCLPYFLHSHSYICVVDQCWTTFSILANFFLLCSVSNNWQAHTYNNVCVYIRLLLKHNPLFNLVYTFLSYSLFYT